MPTTGFSAGIASFAPPDMIFRVGIGLIGLLGLVVLLVFILLVFLDMMAYGKQK
jgi:hypothetical protein